MVVGAAAEDSRIRILSGIRLIANTIATHAGTEEPFRCARHCYGLQVAIFLPIRQDTYAGASSRL